MNFDTGDASVGNPRPEGVRISDPFRSRGRTVYALIFDMRAFILLVLAWTIFGLLGLVACSAVLVVLYGFFAPPIIVLGLLLIPVAFLSRMVSSG